MKTTLIVIVLLLLSSCAQKKSSTSHNSNVWFGDVTELEAKQNPTQVTQRSGFNHREALQRRRTQKKSAKEQEELLALIHLQEARLSDVPIPLNSEPLLDFFNNDFPRHEISLGYKSGMLPSEATKFYLQEMERLGWHNVAFFSNLEYLLNFVRPGKFCSVSIRPYDEQLGGKREYVKIFIFTGPSIAVN